MQPQDIAQASKEELVNRYLNLGYKEEEIAAEKQVLKEEIVSRIKDNGEVIGDYNVTKVERTTYNFKMTLEQARDLGAVKETVDNDTLKKLYLKKVKLPVEPTITTTIYPLIKEIERQ
jgi:hypothetical protein